MSSQTLPFTCRVVTTPLELRQACAIRGLAYGNHLPGVPGIDGRPDAIDYAPGTMVLICHDKETGAPVGTARVQVSTQGCRLPVETCVELPPDMAGDGRAEITKLAAVPGAHPLVRVALWKAGYLYCLANQTRWLLIGARNPALVRQYRRLGAVPLHDDARSIPLPYAAGIPHQILVFDVIAAERHWYHDQHAMFGFMFETVHPDINLFPQTVSLVQEQAREAA